MLGRLKRIFIGGSPHYGINKAKFVVGFSSICVFILIWYMGTNGTKLGELMAGPVEVASRLVHSMYEPIGTKTIFGHLAASISRVMVGFAVAAVCGILLGLSMGWNRYVEAIAKPLFELVRPIPPIAWISLAVLWFGLGETAKYFIIFLSGFFNITINIYVGAKSVDKELIGAAKMLGCSEHRMFSTIVMPSSVPYIFTGLHIALSSSWAAVVAAEMVRSTDGVGWIITRGMSVNDTSQIMVGILTIGIVGFLLSSIMRGVEAKLCAWSRVQE